MDSSHWHISIWFSNTILRSFPISPVNPFEGIFHPSWWSQNVFLLTGSQIWLPRSSGTGLHFQIPSLSAQMLAILRQASQIPMLTETQTSNIPVKSSQLFCWGSTKLRASAWSISSHWHQESLTETPEELLCWKVLRDFFSYLELSYRKVWVFWYFWTEVEEFYSRVLSPVARSQACCAWYSHLHQHQAKLWD